MSNNLPTLNQYIGPGGYFPQTVPAYGSGSNDKSQQQNPQQPQQQQPPQWNQNQPPQWNQNQPPQWNQNQQQPQWNPNQQQPQWNQNQPPQWNPNQQQPQWNPNQQQPQWNQQQYQQNYYYNFSNEIYNLRNQYRMNIPDNQVDQTIEQAIQNKRMYAFPENEKNYLRYDPKGRSFISPIHSFGWAHKDNPQFFELKHNLPNSYDGTSAYLIKVCWIDMKCKLNHVKPGNYKLFVNQMFDNAQIKDQMTIRVFVGARQVFEDKHFPNAQMAQNKNMTESYICSIKKTDFEMDKLDVNGDAVVRVEFSGNNNSWKKGWTLDGVRIEEEN
jgi:hypothetical protein